MKVFLQVFWSFFCSMMMVFNVVQSAYPENALPAASPDEISFVEGITSSPERLIPLYWRHYPTGTHNAITDVSGVKIGHITVVLEAPHKIRTGITAIVPDVEMLTQGKGNLANTGFWASAVTLNGNGELTGMGPLQSSGILNAPILWTNTFAVGTVYNGVFDYFEKHFPGQWMGQIPVVGECWDGIYNTISDRSVLTSQDASQAIEFAQSGPVPQGRVGAGTGMRSFEIHGGIGSASRKILIAGKEYILGILVNTNHSRLERLNPLVKAALGDKWGALEKIKERDDEDKVFQKQALSSRQGSIMVVIATDMPLMPQELRLVAERAVLGIGNMGSVMATTSGDFAIAFSTAHPISLRGDIAQSLVPLSVTHPEYLTPVFEATVEAVTEAQINAMVASHTSLAKKN